MRHGQLPDPNLRTVASSRLTSKWAWLWTWMQPQPPMSHHFQHVPKPSWIHLSTVRSTATTHDKPGHYYCWQQTSIVHISPLCKCKQATKTLLSFQKQLLLSLKQQPKLLFPETYIGLGPCSIIYDQYIEDVLLHLMNEDIYLCRSHKEDYSTMHNVKKKINSWLSCYHIVIGKQANLIIRHQMSKNSMILLLSSTSCIKSTKVGGNEMFTKNGPSKQYFDARNL